MAKKRMTAKIKRGLSWLVEFGRSYLEGDDYESVDAAGDRADIEAALKFFDDGGLSELGREPEKRP